MLFLGFAAYVRHLSPAAAGPQAAALLLALFYETPVSRWRVWTGHLGRSLPAVLLASDDANPALQLWGFEHTAIAIGLMPVFLLAAERLLAGRASAVAPGSAVRRGGRRCWSPGCTPGRARSLLGSLAGVVPRGAPRAPALQALVCPVAATLAPLVYGLVLSHVDASWHAFQANVRDHRDRAVVGAAGVVRPAGACSRRSGCAGPRDDREWLLVLWLLAYAGVYFLVPQFPPHALAGVTLPLAVLAVRGWDPGRAAPRRASAARSRGPACWRSRRSPCPRPSTRRRA